MREVIALWREEPAARRFFLAYALAAVGRGSAYVALLLLVRERGGGAWAIGLVLAAEIIPSIVAGPLLGALADRWPRHACVVGADLIRAAALAAVLLVHSIPLMVLFVTLLGVGTGLAQPAGLAWAPGLVAARHETRVLSLMGATSTAGLVAGPAIAAATLAVGGPATVLAVSVSLFALSGGLLASIREPERTHTAERRSSGETLRLAVTAGLRLGVSTRELRGVLLAAGVAFLCFGMVNVAEPALVIDTLDAGAVGFGVVVAVAGIGIVTGTLLGHRSHARAAVRRRFLAGLALAGVSLASCGAAPTFVIALPVFALLGCANGMILTNQRLLVHEVAPRDMAGRVFALLESAINAGLAVAFVAGAALTEAAGPRAVFLIGAASTALVLPVAWILVRAGSPVEFQAPVAGDSPV